MKFVKKYVLIDQDNYQRLTKSNKVETTQTKHLFQHPDVKITKKQHERMEQIANGERLSDSEKLLHHSQALKRYLKSFKDAIKLSKSQAILGDIRVKRDLSLATESQTSATTPLKAMTESQASEPTLLKTESDTEPSEADTKTIPLTPNKSSASKTRPSHNLTVSQIVNSLPSHTRGKARKLLTEVKKVPSLKWTKDGGGIYRGKTIKGSDIKQLIGDILDKNGIPHRQSGDGRSDYSHFEKNDQQRQLD